MLSGMVGAHERIKLGKVRAILMTMKDLMVGVTGSLIASGIATQIPELLSQLVVHPARNRTLSGA